MIKKTLRKESAALARPSLMAPSLLSNIYNRGPVIQCQLRAVTRIKRGQIERVLRIVRDIRFISFACDGKKKKKEYKKFFLSFFFSFFNQDVEIHRNDNPSSWIEMLCK